MLLIAIMETEQFNIRMSKELLYDLETISRLLKVGKTEWVKARLAKEIHDEKSKLLLELSTLYASGMVSKKDLEELVGKKIAGEMEFIKNATIKSVRRGVELGERIQKRRSVRV